jgi:geranylgeranyl pyrophosphate synthase
VPSDLETYFQDCRRDVEAALDRILAASRAPAVVAEPIRYAALGPGKRLRPILTISAAESVAPQVGLDATAARTAALPAACAVEMIHAYSLVHDDLPAMDDDALRRGRPTTHVVYGDGMAILAGDGLLTDAFRVLASWPEKDARDAASTVRRIRAVARLAEAAGSAGMVGGQAIDLAAAGQSVAADAHHAASALEDMHGRKTGALIRAAAVMGAILVGADTRLVDAIDVYARELGLAFQIVDDILDVEGSADALGKTAGKDAAAGKPTFPALYGIAESRRRAAACVDRAHSALTAAGIEGRLGDIADWSLARTR